MKFDPIDYPPLKDVDNLTEQNHSMVLYDNEEYGKLVKCRYIENGLKKGEHSICITHDDVDKTLDELASCGIDVNFYNRKKLLHVYQIENIMERPEGIIAGFNDIVKKITADSKPPYRFVGRTIPNVCTTEGIKAELEIEKVFQSNFEKYDCSFLCTYAVNDIEGSRRPFWLRELMANHHHLIYASDPANAVTFDPDMLHVNGLDSQKNHELQNEKMSTSDYMVAFSGLSKSYCVGVVDMVNSTKISARMNEIDWSRYYKIFLNSIAKILTRYGGVVIKNMGDSLLYFFPESSNSQRKYGFISCLECTLAIIESHDDICKILAGENLPCLDYRVSADYGRVVIMNSNNSSTPDLIGPPVNMCTKINHRAENNGVVIGGDLYQVVKNLQGYRFRHVAGFSLGLKYSYPIYSVSREK